MERLRQIIAELHRRSLWQVLGIYLAASWVAFEVVTTFTESLDLPEWVPGFALVLLVIGLPIVLATAFVQEGAPRPEGGDGRETASPGPAGDVEEAAGAGGSGPAAPDADDGPSPGFPGGTLLTWRNALLGGVLAFSLLFGVAGLFVLLRDGRTPLVPEEVQAEEASPAIAVLPFTVRGEGLDLLREGMVDLLSHTLDGAAGFRAISNRTVLARWRERAGEDGEADLAASLDVARSTGARYALLGSAVRLGDRARLVGDVHAAGSGERVASVSVEGDPGDLGGLADRLAVETLKSLLRERGSFPGVDASRVITDSPEALRAYLEGERLMRSFRQQEAAEAFRRAIREDSAFALAHWRLVEVHTWGETADTRRRAEHLEAAHRHRDRLTDRDALLVEALVAPAREEARMLRSAVERYPDDTNAWYLLGEALVHAPQLFATASEVERAFRRALRLDPRRPAFYPHAIVLALHRADSARAADLVARYGQLSRPEGPYQFDVDPRAGPYAVRLAFGDSAVRARQLAALDTLPPRLAGAVTSYLESPAYWETSERLLRGVLERAGPSSYRAGLRRKLAGGLLLEKGGVREALELNRAEPSDAVEPGSFWAGDRWPLVFYRARVAGVPVPDSVLDRLLYPALEGEDAPAAELFYAGSWAIEAGDEDRLDRARSQLAARVDSGARRQTNGSMAESQRRPGSQRARRALRLLEARQALARGRAGEAVTILEEEASGAWVVQWWLGEAYLEAGRHERAARAFGTYGWPETFTAFGGHPPVRRQLARALEELGRDEEAARAYRYFARHWSDADPRLQPLVEAARERAAELARAPGAP